MLHLTGFPESSIKNNSSIITNTLVRFGTKIALLINALSNWLFSFNLPENIK